MKTTSFNRGMLYTASTIFILAIVIIIEGCSLKEKQLPENSDLNGRIQFDFSKLNLDETRIISVTDSRVPEKRRALTNQLFSELDDAMEGKADKAVFRLSNDGKNIVLSDIFLIDTKIKVIVDQSNTNKNNKYYSDMQTNGLAEFMDEIMYGKCPTGWTSVGSCINRDCIASKTDAVLEAQLGETGDCVQLQYARGALGVQICTKSCSGN